MSDDISSKAKFAIGQIVEHRLFNYRGVVFDLDPVFMLSDEWYEQMAKSCPPKDQPWYQILVHNGIHTTYVAERNLCLSDTIEQIDHPALGDYFKAFTDGRYLTYKKVN